MIYGSKMQKLWESVDQGELIAYWDRSLAEWTDAEIAKAVAHLRQYWDFPPTLPEFIKICREHNRVAI